MDNETTTKCKNGILIPIWMPDDNWSVGDRVGIGLIHFVVLCYLLVGIAFVSNRLMGAIEVITSQERKVTIKLPKGGTQVVKACLWNSTIANLTLMVVGSSAPEILFCIVDLFCKPYQVGDISFGALAGCAAFRFFIVTAVCVYIVPTNEARKIKVHDVFFTLAFWAYISYAWFVVIINEFSPGVIKVWEALLTFGLFPATVVTTYLSTKNYGIWLLLCDMCCKKKKKEVNNENDQIAAVESGVLINNLAEDTNTIKLSASDKEVVDAFNNARKDYTNILYQLRHDYPNNDLESLENLAREEISHQMSNSRACYWIEATQRITGGTQLLQNTTRTKDNPSESHPADKTTNMKIFYDQRQYVVTKTTSNFEVAVIRDGGDLSCTVLVDISTEDGTAKADSDYTSIKDTVVFRPNETKKQIKLFVIDDKKTAENKHFSVHLSNCRLSDNEDPLGTNAQHSVCLSNPSSATVMIVNNNHRGIFTFSKQEYEFSESIGTLRVSVSRLGGSHGRAGVSYTATSELAKAGKHYNPTHDTVTFEEGETEKNIEIQIDVDDFFEDDFDFYIDLSEPKRLKAEYSFVDTEEDPEGLLNAPSLGDITRTNISIKANKEFKDVVDRFLNTPRISFVLRTVPWIGQFQALANVPSGYNICAVDAVESTTTSCLGYALHCITLFWKVICALVPPADYIGGWPCLLASLLMTTLLTCLIRDFSSLIACILGVPDFIIAITIVSVGLCTPDIFASKLAAVNEKYADTCLNCLTATIPVGLFLGGGITFLVIAISHAINGTDFIFHPGKFLLAATILFRMLIVVYVVLLFRRLPCVKGELGGPMQFKIPTILLLTACWLAFVLMPTIQ